ncbi:uncharacterized protein METZ01_LOCUS439598, partial [marine metagenome]
MEAAPRGTGLMAHVLKRDEGEDGRAAGARLSLAKGHPLDSHWLLFNK